MLEPTTPKPISPQYLQKFAEWMRFSTCEDPELTKLATACCEWALSFREGRQARWLTIIGRSGTGKTHCASRLFDWAASRSQWGGTSYSPHRIYWPDFVQQLRGGNQYGLRDDLKAWPVLFIDDIGAANESEFSFGELNTLLGCREGQWTLITSNMEVATLANVDGRIASRLIRGRNIIVEVKTRDYATR